MKSRASGMLALATATVVWTWGCGGASLPEGDPSSAAAPGASASPSATAPAAASPASATPEAETVTIRGFAHGADGNVLPGVEVCLFNGTLFAGSSDNPVMCADSAPDGSFAVSGAAAKTSVTLTFQKDGFAPTARAMALGAQDVSLPSSENVLYADPMVFMGAPADSTKGQIAFVVTKSDSGPTPQVTATLDGYFVPKGNAGPAGAPVYFDASGAPAPAATAGTAGGFANVEPGLYAITLHATSGLCLPNSGNYGYSATLQPNGDTSLFVPVIQGYVTGPVGVWCTSYAP